MRYLRKRMGISMSESYNVYQCVARRMVTKLRLFLLVDYRW